MKSTIFALFIFLLFSCYSYGQASQHPAEGLPQFIFLDQYIIPNGTVFEQTKVGGLSGIDYDASKNRYFFMCDDRGEHNPPRFYTARFLIDSNKIKDFTFLSVDTLKKQNGSIYHSNDAIDPEDMRYNARLNQVVWVSEGERIENAKQKLLVNPSVNIADSNGKLLYQLAIPAQFMVSQPGIGPRKNTAFEGLSFCNNDKNLFVSNEGPLYQDGELADIEDKKYWCRIIRYDMQPGKKMAQYAYPLSPVVDKPFPATAFRVNGIAAILALGQNELLVLERSYSTGKLNMSIRLYNTNLKGATDIQNNNSLIKNPAKNPLQKKLLFDFNSLHIPIDNIEGFCFGPRLANGHRSLLFISDNNFNFFQRTQLLLFDVGE